MNCPNCGAAVQADDRFCTSCGSRVPEPATAPAVPPPPAPPAPPTPARPPTFAPAEPPRPPITYPPGPALSPPPPPSGNGRPVVGLVVAGAVVVIVVIGVVFWLANRPSGGNTPVATTTAQVTTPPPQPTTTEPDPVPTTSEDVPTPPPTGSTDGLVSVAPDVADSAGTDVVTAVVAVFDTYFSGINSADYPAAYDEYSDREQGKIPYSGWLKGNRSSQTEKLSVNRLSGAVTALGTGNVVAEVTFRSHQPAAKSVNKHQTCTDWSLAYTLVPSSDGNGYRIDGNKPGPGKEYAAC